MIRRMFWTTLCMTVMATGASLPAGQTEPEESLSPGSAAKELTVEEAIALAREYRGKMDDVKDYTGVFSKTEKVGDRVVQQTMDIKLRREPLSVYLRFNSSKERGREVIFVSGANSDYLLCHERGLKALAGTLRLKPDDAQVMEENRYAITEVGMCKLVDRAVQIWEEAARKHPKGIKMTVAHDGKVGTTPCDVIQIVNTDKSRDLKFHIGRVYFDKQTKQPIAAEQFGLPESKGGEGPLLERYTYTDLKTNVGLSDGDFDASNPKYGFGGAKLSRR